MRSFNREGEEKGISDAQDELGWVWSLGADITEAQEERESEVEIRLPNLFLLCSSCQYGSLTLGRVEAEQWVGAPSRAEPRQL